MKAEQIVLHSVIGMLPVWHNRGDRMHMKNRSHHGLVIVQSGRYLYWQGEHKVPSDPYHVIYLPKGGVYESRCTKEDCSLVVNFECNLNTARLDHFSVSCGPELVMLSKRIGAERNALRRMSLMYELLARLAENKSSDSNGMRVIRRGVEYLESNFDDPELNMTKVAQHAAVSAVYFRKCFTEAYGIPPLRYVQQLRMNKAQQLLCEQRLTVEQVALACGYKSVYSFSNAFHRWVGLSPTGYAHAQRNI